MPAVRLAHLDLPRLQGEERGRAVPARDPQHPLHLGEHVRPADVEPHDGARARGGAARRHEVGEDLAVFHGAPRARVPRRAGDRVHRVRAQGPDDEHQPVRLHVFVLTGTHGAHVAVGVLWLLTLGVRALQGKLGPANAMTVEITGLYWHFVDVVWIIIFTVVYLIQ